MHSRARRIVTALLILCLLMAAALPKPAGAAELMTAVDFIVHIEGESQPPVDGPGIRYSESGDMLLGAYTNNRNNKMYLSLRDLAAVLNGTAGQFEFDLDKEQDSFFLNHGMSYTGIEVYIDPEAETIAGDHYDEMGNLFNAEDILVAESAASAERPDYEYLDYYINPLLIDGKESKYYSMQLSLKQDLYVDPVDAQLILGVTIEKESSGVLRIRPDGFHIDLAQYQEDGYFDLLNGVVLGNADTGEILFGCKADNPDAIASTSKLMTYLITARYLAAGKIGLDDTVTLSENVGALLDSGYGTLTMYAGDEFLLRDLIAAMLLPSSNEAALAVAEYVAGSEPAFVKLMNEMAEQLGLTTAKFYNASGLPVYSDSLIASARQNYMSASDLFRLSAAIVNKYPEISVFTSQKTMEPESFDYAITSTNNLLWNMDSCFGLKTGTTDEAGCCFVGAANVPLSDGNHTLIAVVLGANSNLDRFQIPELLFTWASQTF